MKNERQQSELRDLTREALRIAASLPEPELDRLMDAVPAMLMQARHIQQSQGQSGLPLAPVARWMLPRLSLATAVLSMTIFLLSAYDVRISSTQSPERQLNSLLLTGNTTDNSSDPLLQALTGQEYNYE